MPCLVDVGAIVGAVSCFLMVSPAAAAVFSFWNTGVVLPMPAGIPRRSTVLSAEEHVRRESHGGRAWAWEAPFSSVIDVCVCDRDGEVTITGTPASLSPDLPSETTP